MGRGGYPAAPPRTGSPWGRYPQRRVPSRCFRRALVGRSPLDVCPTRALLALTDRVALACGGDGVQVHKLVQLVPDTSGGVNKDVAAKDGATSAVLTTAMLKVMGSGGIRMPAVVFAARRPGMSGRLLQARRSSGLYVYNGPRVKTICVYTFLRAFPFC